MDIQMPVMDGITAVCRLRQRERAGGTTPHKVFALTASVMKDDIARFLSAGMDGVLAKPVQVAELDCILESLHQSQGTLSDQLS